MQSLGQTESVPQRGQFLTQVRESRQLGSEYRCLTLSVSKPEVPYLSEARPGQFIQIACRKEERCDTAGIFLRRPFSIAALRANDTTVEVDVIHDVIGPGTAWMGGCQRGDAVPILGPLGNGFALPENNTRPVILLGGGIGIPPLLFLADRLREQGQSQVLGVIGLANGACMQESLDGGAVDPSDLLKPGAVLKEFNHSGTPALVATDDGSLGYHGNAVDALGTFLEQNPPWQQALIYSCGPEGMLKATAQLAQERSMECQVCLEAYMACGFGVCQSCVVPVHCDTIDIKTPEKDRWRYALVCDDGPVFDSRAIIWD